MIGGGTGSFNVLQAAKSLTQDVTALVSMADDGGSTGILRDELGALPPGDVRQCLVALSDTPHLRDLFNYRFDGGSLSGHTLGNLLLTALEKQTGSFAEAVATASQVLNITGRVMPVTFDNVRLALDTAEGKHIEGEHRIDIAKLKAGARPRLSLVPEPQLNPEAAQAIMQADLVVIAPGDLYTSLAPALIVPGIGQALADTPAKVIYICNLVVKPGHTDGMSVLDHAAEVERFAAQPILDAVVYNTATPSRRLLERYQRDQEFMVKPLTGRPQRHYQLIGCRLLPSDVSPARTDQADKLAARRSFIRHDIGLLSLVLANQLAHRSRLKRFIKNTKRSLTTS